MAHFVGLGKGMAEKFPEVENSETVAMEMNKNSLILQQDKLCGCSSV